MKNKIQKCELSFNDKIIYTYFFVIMNFSILVSCNRVSKLDLIIIFKILRLEQRGLGDQQESDTQLIFHHKLKHRLSSNTVAFNKTKTNTFIARCWWYVVYINITPTSYLSVITSSHEAVRWLPLQSTGRCFLVYIHKHQRTSVFQYAPVYLSNADSEGLLRERN